MFGVGRVEWSFGGVHGALVDDFDVGGVTLDVGLQFGEDFAGRLGFNETDIAFGKSFVGEDRLRSGASIAAMEAIDGEGGPGGEALGDAALLRLIELLQVKRSFDFFGVNW